MEKTRKINFLRQFFLSITSFENYKVFLTDKAKQSLKYIFKLALIFSIVMVICMFLNNTLISDELYNNFLEQYTNNEFVKQGQENIQISKSTFSTMYAVLMFLYLIFVHTVSYFFDAVILALLGYITSKFIKIKIDYKMIFNISIHSLTLPIILNIIYFIISTFTGYNIKYFQVMYTAISYIYLITVLLIIKSDMMEGENNNASK